MISHGEGFVLRHVSGRYFNSDCYSPGFKAGEYDASAGVAFIYRLTSNPFEADLNHNREHLARFLGRTEWLAVADQFETVHGPGCACCGERWGWMLDVGAAFRCEKHKDRNPCAIEGCKRTTAADGRYANDAWLCSEHWRRFVPPHSAQRRAYLRFFRIARKRGWDDQLGRRFWRFWRGLVNQARRKAEGGAIDERAINELFGWSDAA